MGIFKSTKARNIFIYSICALGVAASIATICVVLWPKGEANNIENKKTSSTQDTNQKKSILVDQTCLSNAKALGPTESEINDINLAVSSATKTVQMYDAELKCYEGTDTNIYYNTIEEIKSKKAELEQLLSAYPSVNAQTYTYSEPTNTTTPTPTYNVPDYTPTPSPTPTCADYHARYYAEYQSELSSTNSHYANAINSATASCSSFGGCPQKTSLERQWETAVAQLKNSYKSNMSSVGCDPNEYVNF